MSYTRMNQTSLMPDVTGIAAVWDRHTFLCYLCWPRHNNSCQWVWGKILFSRTGKRFWRLFMWEQLEWEWEALSVLLIQKEGQLSRSPTPAVLIFGWRRNDRLSFLSSSSCSCPWKWEWRYSYHLHPGSSLFLTSASFTSITFSQRVDCAGEEKKNTMDGIEKNFGQQTCCW